MTLRLNLMHCLLASLWMDFAGSVPAHAQFRQATLQAHVVDQTGAPVQMARVTIAGDPGLTRTVVTGQSGEILTFLEPGRYVVTVDADGFEPVSQSLAIELSESRVHEFVLRVAGFTDRVTVAGHSGPDPRETATATRTLTPLRDVPQSITVVGEGLIRDQLMTGMADVVRYVPGITAHQGENNRDQVVIRGNSSSADFYVNGVRDDVQYYRDTYNVERIEALKGPNGMTFGRGGGGGVINRVTKAANFTRAGDVALVAGSYGSRRLTADINQPLTGASAFRVNGVFEDSGSFRSGVTLQRYGIAPTVTFIPGGRTTVTIDYERFHDARVADRGIPSYHGVPADIGISTFVGNVADSHVRADVNLSSASVEHRTGAFTLRNRTMAGHYDRAYQNYVPGAVSDDRTLVALSAYNNATRRLNVFNQTDVIHDVRAGRIRHTLLVGAEIGRQATDNLRKTGFFDNVAPTMSVPYANPVTTASVVYRPSATDADNHVRTNVAALYSQEQVELSRFLQLVGGLRIDRFELRYHNNRNGENLRRVDDLVSPRAGVIVKPVPEMSVYSSYTLSSLPSSGDQFSSLTAITQQMKPERFTNYEVGAKWDARPSLAITTAVYRLDRTNTRSTDPSDPTRIVQTGGQRTNGYELGVDGSLTTSWKIAGGYANQNAAVVRPTTVARAGAQVGQVPHHTFSLWNSYQILTTLGAAMGVVRRTAMFAAIDNAVTLPGYTRVDAATYVTLTERARLQVNVENVFNRTYYVNADSNTNISPGSPRTLRVALTAAF